MQQIQVTTVSFGPLNIVAVIRRPRHCGAIVARTFKSNKAADRFATRQQRPYAAASVPIAPGEGPGDSTAGNEQAHPSGFIRLLRFIECSADRGGTCPLSMPPQEPR